jgi:hypothetical protein
MIKSLLKLIYSWSHIKDGKDEGKVLCGNLYGSNEMFNAHMVGVTKLWKERKEKYKYEIKDDKYTCRKFRIFWIFFLIIKFNL